MNTTQLILDYLKDVEADNIKTSGGLPLKAATKRSYKHAIDLYVRFGVFDLLSIKPTASPEERKELTKKFQKHIEDFTDSLQSSINTRAAVVNIIGVVLNRIANDLMISIPRVRRIKPVEQPIMTLSDTFVKRFLTDEEMYNSLSGRYKAMWEVCAIMLVTSLRISDATALKEMDFDENADGLFLLKQNEKTAEVTTCPLTPLLSKIIKNNLKNGSVYHRTPVRLLPDGVRKRFPEFFKLYPETHINTIVRKYDLNRKISSITLPLYKAIHPHMLRKTSITMMLTAGVSQEHVKFASGHSRSSKSFERYIGFNDQRYQSQISNFHKTIV